MVEFDSSGIAREREGALDHGIRRSDRKLLGRIVRDAREKCGLRQGELAERLATPQSVVSRIELGHRELTVLELRVICRALGISFAEIATTIDIEIGKHS